MRLRRNCELLKELEFQDLLHELWCQLKADLLYLLFSIAPSRCLFLSFGRIEIQYNCDLVQDTDSTVIKVMKHYIHHFVEIVNSFMAPD